MGLSSAIIKTIREQCKEARRTHEQMQTLINKEPCLATLDLLINLMQMFRSFSCSDVNNLIYKLIQEQFMLGRTEVIVIVDNSKHVPTCKNDFKPRNSSLLKKGVIPYPKEGCLLVPDGIIVEGETLQYIDPDRFRLSRHLRKPLLDFVLAQVDSSWVPKGCRLSFQIEAEGELTVWTSEGCRTEEHHMPHGEYDLSAFFWRRKYPNHHTVFISSDSDVVALALTQLKPHPKAYTFWQMKPDEIYDLQLVVKTMKAYTGLSKDLLMCWFILGGTDYYDVSGHWSTPPEDYIPEIKEDGKVKRRKRKREELLSAGVHYMIGIDNTMDAIRACKTSMKVVLTDSDETVAFEAFETFLVELYRHLIIRIDKEIINIPSDVTIHKLRSLFQGHTKYFFPSPDDIQVSLSQLRFCYNYWQCKHYDEHYHGQSNGLLRM